MKKFIHEKVEILIPQGIYYPDEWTIHLLELSMSFFQKKPPPNCVVDIGTGSGIFLLFMHKKFPNNILNLIGCDTNPICKNLVMDNFKKNDFENYPTIHICDARSNEMVYALKSANFIFLNIPQLHHSKIPNNVGEKNDFYEKNKFVDDDVESFGLGLARDILTLNQNRLTQQIVAMNFTSRVPRAVIQNFIKDIGGEIIWQSNPFKIIDNFVDLKKMSLEERKNKCRGKYYFKDKVFSATQLKESFVGSRKDEFKIEIIPSLLLLHSHKVDKS